MRRTNPSSEEAVTYLLQALPNREKYNLYYWYYGTLAMFQHGGEPWDPGTGRCGTSLVSEQIKTGRNAGAGIRSTAGEALGPDLFDGDGDDVPRGLLPLPAALLRRLQRRPRRGPAPVE